jgi:hypothetical protein
MTWYICKYLREKGLEGGNALSIKNINPCYLSQLTVAPARLRGVLRDEGWLLHVSGVYSEMKGVTVAPTRLRGVLSDEEGSP